MPVGTGVLVANLSRSKCSYSMLSLSVPDDTSGVLWVVGWQMLAAAEYAKAKGHPWSTSYMVCAYSVWIWCILSSLCMIWNAHTHLSMCISHLRACVWCKKASVCVCQIIMNEHMLCMIERPLGYCRVLRSVCAIGVDRVRYVWFSAQMHRDILCEQ